MDTLTTSYLTKIYTKRVLLVESKWNELIKEQKQMSFDERMTDEFQSKKKRVGALYHRINNIIQAPKKEAINGFLKGFGENMIHTPQGITTANFNNL